MHIFKVAAKKQRKPIQITLAIASLLLYVLLFQKLINVHKQQLIPLVSLPATTQKINQQNNLYQTLGYRETTDLQNFYFLYTGKDENEDAIHKLTLNIRKTECKKLCIINIYDNKQAYSLDMQRLDITDPHIMEEWNNKNYVFVAEHYLGYLGPLESNFSYFPFKDWYYRSKITK
jgi:hypothetical protein